MQYHEKEDGRTNDIFYAVFFWYGFSVITPPAFESFCQVYDWLEIFACEV